MLWGRPTVVDGLNVSPSTHDVTHYGRPMRDYLLLRGLSDETRDALLGLTRRRTYARNEVVFHDGDPADALFLITKGRAAVRVQTPLGDVATLRVPANRSIGVRRRPRCRIELVPSPTPTSSRLS